MADGSIRRSSDIYSIIDSQMIVAIPYIVTNAERRRRKLRVSALAVCLAIFLVGAMAGSYFFLPPLDLIIAKARVGLF
jgi:hypothetical protein